MERSMKCLVKLFIENSMMLERMAFSFPSKEFNSKVMKEFKENLRKFPLLLLLRCHIEIMIMNLVMSFYCYVG
jgi:hypothetical protein